MQWIGRAVAVLTVIGILGVALSRVAAVSTGNSVERLGWLAGCLEMRSGDRVVEEHRMDLRAGSMLGMGRTTTSKGLMDYELTLIQERAGTIVFEARPSGQPAAVFSATSATADSVVFEAPDHDYPQIVGYRRSGRDSVLAWIDGTRGGKRQRVEFPYRRVACGPKGAR